MTDTAGPLAPPTFDVAIASALSNRVQLRDVIFAAVEARVLDGVVEDGSALSYEMPVADVRWFREVTDLRVVVPYQLNIGTARFEASAEAAPVPIAEIRVLLRVDYELTPDLEITDEQIHNFVGISAFMHSWPYLRAEVTNLTAKLRLPPLVLPVVLSGHAHERFVVSKLQADVAENVQPERGLFLTTALGAMAPAVTAEPLKQRG